MTTAVSSHAALIYVMVTMAAAEGTMTDSELKRIGQIVKTLPAFEGYDHDQLVPDAEAVGEILSQHRDGLKRVLDIVAESLPHRLYETAYALAVEVAAADLAVVQEELRFLQMLRDRFDLDKLVCAAIERGARARHRMV